MLERPLKKRRRMLESSFHTRKALENYNVAKALISGETDKGKMMRELGVSVNTIYNVTSGLTAMGIPLAIRLNRKILIPNSSPNYSPPNSSHFSPESHQPTILGFTPEQTEALLKLLSSEEDSGESGEKELGRIR